MPNLNDVALRYSSTPADRGIYLYTETGWVKQTAPTTDMITKAWPDICRATLAEADGGFPGGPYGSVTDYIGSGVNFMEVLAVQTAFIIKLYAQNAKITGSLRLGDRYDESGNVVDSGKDGIYQDGVTGRIKIAGVEFEGTRGSGVQWSGFEVVGTPTSITPIGDSAIASLGGNRVAFIDDNNDQLRAYIFNGESWSLQGAGLTISGISRPALASTDADTLVFIDATLETLRRYYFNGSSWTLLDSLSIPGISNPALTALSSTDVVLFDSQTELLRTYRYSGGSWAQLGNALSIPSGGKGSLTALSSTDIAIVLGTLDDLRTYRFDGTNWALVGNSFNLDSAEFSGIAALNATDIVFADSLADAMQIYRFNGTSWFKVGSAGTPAGTTLGFCSLCALNGTDVVLIHSNTQSLITCRYGFATSVPYVRTLTGF